MFLKNLFQTKKSGRNIEVTSPKVLEPAFVRLFGDILNSGTSLRVKVTGRSMSPFLRGGEIVTIKKVPHISFRRGDLIFFKNSQGLLVLHRIIKKNDMVSIQTKGDALRSFDEPIGKEEIFGKVCKVEKINPLFGFKNMNMESNLLKTINYLISVTACIESRIYHFLSGLSRKALSSLKLLSQ